jgi:hypothetical protein
MSATSVLPTTAVESRWRTASAVAAIGAPVAELLAVAVGIDHTTDDDRQLDIIAAHTGRFTAMVLLEEVCYLLVAVTAVVVAIRLATSRGGRIAAGGAVLAVIGATANIGGFGGSLPTLAKQSDRDAALYFLDHLGPIYAVNQGLTLLVYLGLLLTFVALWRSGRVAWPWLAASAVGLIASAVMGTGRVENIVAMLVVTAGFVGIARFLADSR